MGGHEIQTSYDEGGSTLLLHLYTIYIQCVHMMWQGPASQQRNLGNNVSLDSTCHTFQNIMLLHKSNA
jgi:hypothetical protein